MADKMRGMEKVELDILRRQDRGVIFSEDDLKALAEGNASFKVYSAADRILQKHRAYFLGALSRGEALQQFITLKGFDEAMKVFVVPHIQRALAAVDILMEKGIITQEDFTKKEHEHIARHMQHLCESCSLTMAECQSEGVKFSKDIYADLTGALADKVVECGTYKKES